MRRIARTVSVLWWPVVLLVGLPVGLLHLPGRPALPRHLPTSAQWVQLGVQPVTRGAVLTVLVGLGWLAWAILVCAVLVDVRRRVTTMWRRLPHLRLPGPLQGLSAAVLGAVAVSSAAGSASAHPATHAGVTQAGTDHRPLLDLAAQTMPAKAVTDLSGRPTSTAARAGAHPTIVIVRVGDQRYTYPVHRGDTLWDISAAWLGNPHRWTDIYQLNRDHYDQHGRMRHGAHIEPGWVLVLPEGATPPHGTLTGQPPTGNPHPQPPAAAVPAPQPSPASQVSAEPVSPTPTASVSASPRGPVAAPLPAPAGIGSAAGSATTGSPSPTRSPGTHRPGIELPGGSWVDLGLAAAISAAASMVWIQRRRRYIPRPPSPTLRMDDPDLAPLPSVVNIIRRGLRDPDPDDDAFDILPGSDLDEDATDEPDEGANDDADVQPFGFPGQLPTPVVRALAGPPLEGWPPAGLGLVGPGAQAAGRGLLAAALAAGGVDDYDTRTHVVIPTSTLATLLGTTAISVPQSPRLRVTSGLDDALKILETQALHRTRVVDAHDVDTVAALRDEDPLEEPLPPILLIADAAAGHERARIAALLAQGDPLDIRGVLLGAWPDGDTVTVAADGTTSGKAARPSRHPDDAGRLAVLTATQTTGLLATLAESHTPGPQPTGPTEAATEPMDVDTAGQIHNDAKAPSAPLEGLAAKASPPGQHLPAGAAVAVSDRAATTDQPAGEHREADDVNPAFDAIDRDVEEGDDGDDDGPGDGHAEVVLLGPPRVVNANPGLKIRPQAWELLVYLAVKGGTATKEAILDDMMPSASAKRAPHRLDTYVYNLRQMLRRAGGRAPYVEHPLRGQTYTLNPQALTIDLWRMREAIAAAQAPTDPAARIAAWRVAVDAYAGPLAQGKDYEWIEPYREATRQQAIDAHLALADALADQPSQALPVLEAAIRHDPYAEPLYQKAMRTHAALGNIEGIRALRRTLSQRLSDIDAEISDDTIALADHLITEVRNRRRSPAGRGGDV